VKDPLEVAEAGEPVEAQEADPQSRIRDYERWFRTQDSQIRVLEQERQKLTALVEHADAEFVSIDPGSVIAWANPSFTERFKAVCNGKDPVGLSCHQGLCRRTSPCAECPVAKVLETKQVAHHELNMLLADKFHHVYATAVPVRSPEGRIEQIMVMLQDLSNLAVLRRSEEAMRTKEQRFRLIFEQAGAGMVTYRADGSFLQVNPTFCTMLGYTESELLRERVARLIHFQDQARVKRAMADVEKKRRRTVEMEHRFVRRDGTPLWCHVTSVWQFDESNEPTYCVALVQDISERKEAEQALEQSQKRYQELVHTIDGIVWESDASAFRFMFVSKQAERILGFPVERWVTQPRFWRNHIHTDDLKHVKKALAVAVKDQRGIELEYRMVADDGRTVWIRDTLSLVFQDGEVVKLRGLMMDVTERKQAEEALRHSEEQLRQSQKMEAIGRLAGGIAHDFNNLLTAITGYGDLLLKGLGEKHKLRREAQEISKAAERAAALTGQLLAFSRQQVLQPKVLDLNVVVSEMEMMLRRLIGEQIVLDARVAGERCAVRADPGQLNQVVLNLAVNARDAMPEGGKLSIVTEHASLDEAACAVFPGVSPGRYVRLAVSDTGTGMNEATKARLFEPFFTTKEQGKGTGLGLSTVYGIVRQSGGHISVDSMPGHGTTFTILLPVVAWEEPQPTAKEDALPEARHGTERILLVEDDDSVRELAREILEMNGYTVVEASNGVEALKVFEAGGPTIDLMVTDLVMPQMGGRDLARKVTPDHPELRVLYLSGYTDSVVLQQGLLDPGSSFLQKPFTPAALAHKVRHALDA
jgi:PAS domain S-box-containing protein